MSEAKHQLIQVLPRLLPGKCGVSDNAIVLAEELEKTFGISTSYVVVNSRETCELSNPITYCEPEEMQEACIRLSTARPSNLLVHVSGYGYQRDGAVTRLANALEGMRRDGQFRIAAFFHELYATSMPWKSAFWYSRRQKATVGRVAELADLVLTNTEHHAVWLRKRRKGAPVQVLPVFSSMGEVETPVPFEKREPVLCVFGSVEMRASAYRQLRSRTQFLQRLAVREILDMGREYEAPADLAGIPVRKCGLLHSADVHAILSKARFGYMLYGPEWLAKSSVLAAYTAHGVIPVVAQGFCGSRDGLTDGVHLISETTAERALASGPQACIDAAWAWYMKHNLHVHASLYADWIGAARSATQAEEQGQPS